MNAMRRLKTELEDLNKNPIENLGLTVGLIDDNNLFEWQCTLEAPSDSLYANGLFFSRKLSRKRPRSEFKTPIYHLNVNPRNCEDSLSPEKLGHVCLNSLTCWVPKFTMRKILSNIFSMLYRANPESPYGLDKRDEFENNRERYDEKAKYYTQIYADQFRNGDPDFGDKWDFSLV